MVTVDHVFLINEKKTKTSSCSRVTRVMFNFIFEGKLGEILAPVVSSNQLFLAIQHHKNAEVENCISTNQFDLNKNAESGYAAIHVACRYNNRLALEIILSQGRAFQISRSNKKYTPLS